MPDFTAPEYASYVALMRDLRLEREWREGDWIGSSQGWTAPMVWTSERELVRPNDRYVWLPQLADWLSLLEVAGMEDFRYIRTIPGGNVHLVTSFMSGSGLEGEFHYADGPTHEEAAARLFMAVTDKSQGA